MADLEKDEPKTRGKVDKPKPSLSQYKEPELMPMREKEVLSRKDQKAKKLLTSDSKRYGIDLGIGDNPTYNYGKTINQAVPKDRPDNLTESARNLGSDDPAIAAKGFMGIKGKAPQQKVPELDSKQLMDDAKKQRKARWGDALTGFGQVMQGKTVNTDKWESEKLQRKRDEQFQEYKDIVQNNQKVKEVWDSKNRDELIDFLDKQKKVRDLTEREEAKLAEARFNKERDYALKQADLAAKMKSGYYNKRTSSGKANPKPNLPFESESILNEMNELSGGSGSSSRNQKRLEEVINDNPEGYKIMVELSNNTSKLRKQLSKKEKAYNEAIKSGNAITAPQLQDEIDQLNSQLEEYQNNMKAILNGKTPEAAPKKPTVNKDGYKSYYGKEYQPETETKQSTTPETQKKLDEFFN